MGDLIKLLEALPALVLSLLGVAAFFLLRPQITAAIDRLQGFEGFGIKVTMQALAEAARQRQAPLAGADSAVIEARLKRAGRDLQGVEILWVDDTPAGNRHEARLFQTLGAIVTCAASTEEALWAIGSAPAERGFRLILSDIERQGPRDGLDMLARLRGDGLRMPVIFYVGTAQQPPPEGAQGIADRPDALVGLVLDALGVA
jgi:CheY-like chemotaxis protein